MEKPSQVRSSVHTAVTDPPLPTEEIRECAVDGVTRADAIPEEVRVRPASDDDTVDIVRLLDAALLTNDPHTLEKRIDSHDVFVAVRAADAADFVNRQIPATQASESDRSGGAKLGVVVLVRGDEALHIDSITTRRSSRGRGIATGLICRSATRARTLGYEWLTATFRPPLREFYETRRFTISQRDGRLHGHRHVGE